MSHSRRAAGGGWRSSPTSERLAIHAREEEEGRERRAKEEAGQGTTASSREPGDDNLAELIRDGVTARAHSLAKLTKHPTLLGTAWETALAALLRAYVPRRFEVLTGTIAREGDLSDEGQLDLMIVDTAQYPLMLREGDLVVALPQAVRVVIEVKSDLDRGVKFQDAVEQTGFAGVLMAGSDYAYTGLFCYGAPKKGKTLRTWLEDVLRTRAEILAAEANDGLLPALVVARAGDANKVPSTAELTAMKDEVRRRASMLRFANLPSIIASNAGAVALKTRDPDTYVFIKLTEGRTALTFLLTRVLEEIAKGGATGLELLTRLFGEETLAEDPLCPPLPIP